MENIIIKGNDIAEYNRLTNLGYMTLWTGENQICLGIKLLTAELDGKKIAFASNTDFLLQVGKNKSAYKTKYTFKGNKLNQAVMYYQGINIGNGYKKRLLMPSSNNPVLARAFS